MKGIISRFSHRLLIHRRLLAALSAGACVFALASSFHGAGGLTASVIVAISAIDTGTTITEPQLAVAQVPPDLVPDNAITEADQAAGKMATASIPSGAILTTASFADASTIAAGHVMIPLTVSAQLLTAIHPGSSVSVFSTDPSGAVTITHGVRVITVPQADASGLFSSTSDDIILVEVPETLAASLAAGASVSPTSVALE